MRLNMNQTTLTRKSILAAACFCFATSLTAQTAGRQESTSLKDTPAAKEPQMVASLNHPASIPAMPLTDLSTSMPPADHSSAASIATPISPAGVDTPQGHQKVSEVYCEAIEIMDAGDVRRFAVEPAVN